MPKYMYSATYSPGSWARMMRIADDRAKAVRQLMESLGGSLESTYWEVSARAVFAIADLPDSSAAAAVAAVLSQSGAFKQVEANEVLTQDQFTGVLELADNVSEVYRVPGHDLLEDDTSQSRFHR
jgi:uncharacterized protein with GYD domain